MSSYERFCDKLTYCLHIGYKLRTHIGQALKTRSKAIRTALDKYNMLAQTMQPPAPTLQWKDVVNYGFVAEFDLLKHRHSHFDITSLPWASPANREVANKFHKVRRAKEEILRLNIEIRRLHTFIDDEEIRWSSCATDIAPTTPLLSAELLGVYQDRCRINVRLLERLNDIKRLDGYSGSYSRGTRQQRKTPVLNNTSIRIPDDASEHQESRLCHDDGMNVDNDAENEDVDQGIDIDLDDALNDMMIRWNDFLETSL